MCKIQNVVKRLVTRTKEWKEHVARVDDVRLAQYYITEHLNGRTGSSFRW